MFRNVILFIFLTSFIFSQGQKKSLDEDMNFIDGPALQSEKIYSNIPSVLSKTVSNSVPEFLSATSDSVYEDSAYSFNVLTSDPDGNSVSVSVASSPNWLSLAAKAGGGMTNITEFPYRAGELATKTPIDYISDVVINSSGVIYYADWGLSVIRKIDNDGKISDFAGSAYIRAYAGDGEAATSASLNRPAALRFDSNNNAYIADMYNHRIRKVDGNGIITTFAGTGEAGYSGDGGAATSAKLHYPTGIDFDASGNMYIADRDNHRIRKVDTNGNISTIAGTGEAGNSGDGGAWASAKLNKPIRVGVGPDGHIYIADYNNHVVRILFSDGNIYTSVGTNGSAGFSGDGGVITSAKLNYPVGGAWGSAGYTYIADSQNHRIRRISTKINSAGIISTFAGTGTAEFSGDGGYAKSASLSSPEAMVFYSNSLYIADAGNDRLRKVEDENSTASEVSLVSKTEAPVTTGWTNGWQSFTMENAGKLSTITIKVDNFAPSGKTATDFNLYLDVYSTDANPLNANPWNKFSGTPIVTSDTVKISKDIGEVPTEIKFTFATDLTLSSNTTYYFWVKQPSGDPSTIGGQGIFKYSSGTDGGAGNNFGTLYHKITTSVTARKITSIVGTDVYNGDNILANTAYLDYPRNLAFDTAGNLYVADQRSHRIRKIDINGIITTVAGTGVDGFSGDDGPATEAQLKNPRAVTVDKNGNLYISDKGNSRIRKVTTDGIISTIAGTGEAGYSGDGGAATSAKINFPYQMKTDAQGNLYFTEATNHLVRKISTDGTISTVAGTGAAGFSGDNGAATSAQLATPWGMALDDEGNIYISDSYNHRIRKVDTDGNITTIAGTGTAGDSGEGGAATSALLNTPGCIDIDKAGNIYFTSIGNAKVKKILKNGNIVTIAGTGLQSYVKNTVALSAGMRAPYGLTLDNSNNVYISDTFNSLVRKIDNAYHTLSGTPKNADVGTTTMKLTASDGKGGSVEQDFTLKVINVNDAPEIANIGDQTVTEDSEQRSIIIPATDVDDETLTYSAFSDTSGLKVTVSNDTMYVIPATDYFGVANITTVVSDGKLSDSLTFKYTVTNLQDKPYPFNWLSAIIDTINITNTNLINTFNFKWSESKDVDGDTIIYLLDAKIGLTPWQEINEGIDSTNLIVTYKDFLDGAFENFPTVSAATVQFRISATDGIDTVKASNANRILYINRYDYLSTVNEQIPTEFALYENYPNPFNPTTTLRFDLPEVSDVRVVIYNMLGQKIKTFNMNSISAGSHSIRWNATNDMGDPVGAGVYLYQFQAKDFVKTRKMILLK